VDRDPLTLRVPAVLQYPEGEILAANGRGVSLRCVIQLSLALGAPGAVRRAGLLLPC
jgi:hypothetical protein